MRQRHITISGVICLGAIILSCARTLAQNLFMSAWDGSTRVIFEFTPNGARTTFASGLGGPLAFDKAGNLFVADGSTILKFTPKGRSTFGSGLSSPTALAVYHLGNLFVADGSTILKFTPAGVRSTFASGLSWGYGLAFNSAGILFVTDYGSGSILKFTPDGTRTTFVSWSNPLFLAFDSADNLFVTVDGLSSYANKIYKMSPSGNVSTFASNLLFPEAMAFDSAGNLFVGIDGLTDYPSYTLKITPGGKQTTFTSEFASSLAFQPAGTPNPTATEL